MGFPTKVQLITRRASQQWYITFPSALAQAMDCSQGETVEWFVEDRSLLVSRRSPRVVRRGQESACVAPLSSARSATKESSTA